MSDETGAMKPTNAPYVDEEVLIRSGDDASEIVQYLSVETIPLRSTWVMKASVFLLSLLSIFTLACASIAAEPKKKDAAIKPNADVLVQAALNAEVGGDSTLRHSLLETALRGDKRHPGARWHSGYVQVDGNWLTVEAAQRRVSELGLVEQYRKARDHSAGNLAGELLLARWCRQQKLVDLERFHWHRVLQLDPSNKEARGRLGVREFRGHLMTAEQIEAWKQVARQRQKSLEKWTVQLDRWRRDIDRARSKELSEAWQEMSALNDPEAVPALEKAFLGADSVERGDIVTVLGNIKEQVATEALIRISLWADESENRNAAAAKLSERSWFGFVPNLLGLLETPIEYRYALQTQGVSVSTRLITFQETPSATVGSVQADRTGIPMEYTSSKTPVGYWHREIQKQLIAREGFRQYQNLRDSVQAVEHRNARTIRLNSRIYTTLRTATGMKLESAPTYWWDWWKEYNEQDVTEVKPHFDVNELSYRNSPFRNLSCFAAGTPVWTDSGSIAIEKLRPGDKVLSQHPVSGALNYKTVLDTTVRPPSRTLKIKLDDDEIVATLGHPFWKIGVGWQMAKELKAGDRIHSVQGAVMIQAIEAGDMAEAYNLVVVDTNTYFVGKHQLLVHDNMPRRVIDIPVPGWKTTNSEKK